MTFKLGLTGSIGMGKSTTAQMFTEAGCVVWDADAVVHKLYAPGGAAVKTVARLYPDAIENGTVSRGRLKEMIAADPSVLDRLQDAVHPLVATNRAAFVDDNVGGIVVLDIPLLFETGANKDCDAIVVVTVDAKTQQDRVLARGEMTEADFQMILSRQIPDAEKRARADYVITTDTLDNARAQVENIVSDIREKMANA